MPTPVILLLCLTAAIGTIAWYAGAQTTTVLLVALEEAIYLTIYVLPAALLGRCLLRLIDPTPQPRAMHWASSLALGLGTLGLIELGLGLAGWLNTMTLWILLGLSALFALPILVSRFRSRQPISMPPLSLPAIWPVAAIYLGIAIVAASLLPGMLWPDDPHPYDVLIYHLQVPREWFELGRIVPLEHNVFGYFPFNVEIHYLAMMHLRGSPFAAMYQAQFFGILLSAAAALAIWSAARPVSLTGAAIASAAFLLTPWVPMLSSVAYVEPGLMLYVALSMAWLLAAARQNKPGIRPVILAGLFSGLAAGVKLTSLAMFTAPVMAFILITIRPRTKSAAIFLLATIIPLAPWLIRNYHWTGNPVFPLALEQLGKGHFTADQVTRFERAHQPTPQQLSLAARLRAASDQILLDWRFGLVVPPMAIAGLILARRRREAWLCIAIIGGAAVVWLFATHLQSRFFTIALPAMCIAIGLLPRRAIPWSAGAIGVFAIMGITGIPLHSPSTQSIGIDACLAPQCQLAHGALLGLTDPAAITPEEITQNLEAGRTILFVGGGRIFLQPGPMRQILYRTVFDVDASGGRGIVDAWFGHPSATTPPDVVPVISTSELQRLHRTYYAIPAFDPSDAGRFPHAIVTP